jgi:hypothetical protein
MSSPPFFSGHPQHNQAILNSGLRDFLLTPGFPRKTLHHPFTFHSHHMASPFQSSYFYGWLHQYIYMCIYIYVYIYIYNVIPYLCGFSFHLCPSSSHIRTFLKKIINGDGSCADAAVLTAALWSVHSVRELVFGHQTVATKAQLRDSIQTYLH